MTEEMFGLGDPVIRRLQQAFAHEEPTSELAAIMQRAAQYQVWEPPESDDAPVPHHDLTVADLVAARHREPAAVTRIYTAYAPALSRYFLAAVGDHRLAEDLTDANGRSWACWPTAGPTSASPKRATCRFTPSAPM